MYDATNRKEIRRLEKLNAIAESNRVNFLCAAMSQPQGREWMHYLLEKCHLTRGERTFEPFKDYFMDGERNVGLQLFADIQTHCPDAYIKMMQEAHDRSIERELLDRAAAAEQPGSEDPDGGTEAPDFSNLVDYGSQA